MSVKSELAAQAVEFAERFQQRRATLEDEKRDLKSKLLTAETQLNAISGLEKRVASFHQELSAGLICPSCWIQENIRAPDDAIGGGTEDEDFFRCTHCKSVFSAPV